MLVLPTGVAVNSPLSLTFTEKMVPLGETRRTEFSNCIGVWAPAQKYKRGTHTVESVKECSGYGLTCLETVWLKCARSSAASNG